MYWVTLILLQFAIRTNFRNHTILNRDGVIKQVAAAVGPDHQVDLKAFDLLILVEVFQVRECIKIASTSLVGQSIPRPM
jgi:hypothetical protein